MGSSFSCAEIKAENEKGHGYELVACNFHRNATSSETPRLTRGKLVTHQLVSVKHLKRVLIDDEKRMYLHFVTHLEKASIVVIKGHRPPK